MRWLEDWKCACLAAAAIAKEIREAADAIGLGSG